MFANGLVHGRVIRHRRVSGLLLAEVDYPPKLRVGPHTHGHAQFVLVLRGVIEDTSAECARRCASSTLLFLPAGASHAIDVGSAGATALVVDMEPAWLARATSDAAIIDTPADFHGGLLTHLARRLYGEFRLRDEVSRLMIDSLTLGLIAEASRRHARAEAHPPAWLAHARELLRARFASRVPLAELAQVCGVHPVHLARAFRQHYGCTIGDYVRDLRVEFVCRRMRLSNAPLADIAVAAGFADQSHLTRLFKLRTGLTPSEYRRLMGGVR